MVLDEKNYKFYVENKIIELTPLENSLLLYFLENKNRNIFYEELSLNLYNFFDKYTKGTIKVLIARLNKKIYPYLRISTKSKVGYTYKKGYRLYILKKLAK